MFDRVLKCFQDKIREQNYIMTLHAEEEMDNEELTIWDVEYCILSGEIIERQKDRVTSEWKYRIQGQAFDGLEIETIVKLSPTGKLVFITVYTV